MEKTFFKKDKGIALSTLIIIIVIIILLACGITFFMLNNKEGNNINNANTNTNNPANNKTEEKNNTNKVFGNGEYSIIYNLNAISDSFWNEKSETYPGFTNKEYFYRKYEGKVSEIGKGDNLSMPISPSFTMYSEFRDGGGDQEVCDYYVTVDFNKDHIFYPSMVASSLMHTSLDSDFVFYILDSDMNFNLVSTGFNHKMQTTKQQFENNSKANYDLIYEDNNWMFLCVQSNEKTTIYADYYINLAEYDYLNFTIRLNNILSTDKLKEFANKFMDNIRIKMIDDINIKKTIQNMSPKGYVELKQEDRKINLENNAVLDLTNRKIRFWDSNYIQWYDDNLDNGKSYVMLSEYTGDILNNTESDLYSTKSIEYKNIKIDVIYITEKNESEASYRKAYGYNYFNYFQFDLGNSHYTVKCSKNFKDDQEVASYIQYLFDNVIITNN